MKKQNGITLIALIVTIIVLLILAAVSITAITDNDKGIVSKAQQAAKKVEDEKNKEVDVLGKLNDAMDEELNVGTNDEVDFTNVPKLNEIVSSESYGIKTNYSANGIDDWRIFYENEDGRVFLIAADYLPVEKLESGMEMQTTGKYQYFWTNIPTFVTPTQTALFMESGLNSTYINSKCAATLLNVSKWTSFVDTTLADYAIGSPTIEMWIASWNEKYNDDFSLVNGTRGYVLSGGNMSLGYSEAETNNESTGYGNVYFPHPNTGYVSNSILLSYEGCGGYWLASPCDGTPSEMSSISYLFLVNGRGAILSENPITGDPNSSDETQTSVTDAVYNGIRPVVCLKEGVKAVEKADGTLVLGM